MAISSPFDRSRQPSRSDVHVDLLYDTGDRSINRIPAETLALLPKVAIDSDTLVIQRHNADSIGPNAVFRDPATAPTTLIATDAFEFALDADEFPPIAYRLSELNSAWKNREYTYDKLSDEISQEDNDATQAKYGMLKEAEERTVLGTGFPDIGSFDFIIDTLGMGQTTAAAAGSALNNLARLRSMVTALDGRETAHMGFVMNWACWRTVQAAFVTSGLEPPMMRCRDNEIRLSYLGVPIYINDFIAIAGEQTSPVYAVLAHARRGCFIAVNRNCVEPKIYPVNMDQSPFKSYVAEWNLQLVSTTDRALARIPDFPATAL